MAVSGISTIGQQQRAQDVFARKQEMLNKSTKETSTGRVAHVTDVSDPFAYFNAIVQTNANEIKTNNVSASKQIQFAMDAINNFRGGKDGRSGLAEFIAKCGSFALTSTPEGQDSLSQQASVLLDQLQAVLLTTYNGKYIFGGNEGDKAPVTGLQGVAADGSGNADYSYYQGSLQNTQVNVDPRTPDTTINTTSIARDDAIERAIQSLALAKNGHWSKAIEVGKVALDNMANFVRERGDTLQQIENVNDALESVQAFAKETLEKQGTIDIDGMIERTERTAMIQTSQLLDRDIQKSYMEMFRSFVGR